MKAKEVRYYPNKTKQYKAKQKQYKAIVEQFKQLHKFLNKQIMKKQEQKEAKKELLTTAVFIWSVWVAYYLTMKIITI